MAISPSDTDEPAQIWHLPEARLGRLRSLRHKPSESTRWMARVTDPFISALILVLGGYLFLDRAFAWLHVPGTPLFIGEAVLGIGLMTAIWSPNFAIFIRRNRSIQVLVLFMIWGLALTLQGYPTWGIDAVRDAALWYYGLFALILGTLMLTRTDLFDRMIALYLKVLPVWLVFSFFRLAMANREWAIRIPDSDVSITYHKVGNMAVHAGMAILFLALISWPRARDAVERKRLLVYSGLAFVLLIAVGTQTRGGLIAGITVIALAFLFERTGRKLVLAGVGALLALFIVAVALDVSFELERRELSARQFAGNITSLFSSGFAEEGQSVDEVTNTTTWRRVLWENVLSDLLEPERAVSGFGFGANLADRYRYEGGPIDRELRLRNPHNSHLSVLARMGLVGGALWIALWSTWFSRLYKVWSRLRDTEDSEKARLALWLALSAVAVLVNAFFDPTIEGPQVGVWIWSLFGIGAYLGMSIPSAKTQPQLAYVGVPR